MFIHASRGTKKHVAKQAMLRFSKKIWFKNSSKSVIIIKSHFTYHFYSISRDLESNRDDINKNQISWYSFQLIAVAWF